MIGRVDVDRIGTPGRSPCTGWWTGPLTSSPANPHPRPPATPLPPADLDPARDARIRANVARSTTALDSAGGYQAEILAFENDGAGRVDAAGGAARGPGRAVAVMQATTTAASRLSG
jgi:hypothetical protein